MSDRNFGQAATIGTTPFTKLRPIKPACGATALNKSGRLVLYGEQGGRAEKIYEAAGAEHARFIEAVSAYPGLSDCFPSAMGTGRFLIVSWAEEIAKRAAPAEALARLLARIHQTPLSVLPQVGFDYWHDLIKPRFIRVAELLGIDDVAKEIISRVDTVGTTLRGL